MIPATSRRAHGETGSLVTAKAVHNMPQSLGVNLRMICSRTVSQLDESTLQRELRKAVEGRIVYYEDAPQSTYVFKHHSFKMLLRMFVKEYSTAIPSAHCSRLGSAVS